MELIITFLGLLTVTLFVYTLANKFKNRRRDEVLSKLPSPPSYPIIGNAWLLIGTALDAWGLADQLSTEYDTPLLFWLGSIPTVGVVKPDDIEDISKKCLHRETYRLVEETFGDGIITHGYNNWKKTRRLFNAAFGPLMLNQYVTVFNEQSQILIELLKPYADTRKPVDIWPFLVNASIDMISENATCMRPSIQKSFGNDFSEAVIQTLQITKNRIINLIMHNKHLFRIYMRWTGKEKIIKVLHDFPRKTLAKAKKDVELKRQNFQRKNSLSVPDNPPQNIISILLAAHETDPEMTDKQMEDELIQIITAGSETTALTTGFLMLMLGINQDVQEKVYQEIIKVTGENGLVKMDHLSELEYLEQCIKETLRRFTIVPATFRNTTEEIELPSRKKIPAGCLIFVYLKAVHNNPEFYPNPSHWNPENFSSKAIEGRPKNTYIAFGHGPRACLGSKYAMLSIKIQMCYILRNYHVNTHLSYDEIETNTDILLRSVKGYPVMLVSRKGTAQM